MKALVGRMGGSVDLETVAGEGTTFRVWLPVTVAKAPARSQSADSCGAGTRAARATSSRFHQHGARH